MRMFMHACLYTCKHTTACLMATWVIESFSLWSLSLSLTIALSLHGSPCLPLILLSCFFLLRTSCLHLPLLTSCLLLVFSLPQSPLSPFLCHPPPPVWMCSLLSTTLKWSSKSYCSRACEVTASPVSGLLISHLPAARLSFHSSLLSTALHYTYFFFVPLLLPSNLPSSSTLSPSIILLFFHLTLHFSPSLLPSISTSSGLIASHLIFASSLPPFDSSLSLFLFFLPNLCTSLLMLFTPAFTLAVSPLKYCWKRGQTGFLCCAFPCVFLHVSGVLSVGVCCEDVIRLTLFQAAESPAVCSLSN